MSTQPDIRTLFEALVGVPFSDGNRITLLKNGDKIFPAMLGAIAEARESIHFLTYVYWKGDIAWKFAEALIEASKRGVQVRVLLDAVGAHSMAPSLIERMESGGVTVCWFRPVATWKVWRSDSRTHRKLLLCDGRIGFTGGVGIAEEWEGDAGSEDEWRDTHAQVEGPAVHGLLAAFVGNWLEAGNKLEDHMSAVQVLSETGGMSAVQVLRSTSSYGWSDMATLLRLVILGAKSRLRVATAYFVPDRFTTALLVNAARRGVTVQILMPGPITDTRVSQVAGELFYEPLLKAGVELWRYQRTMMHAKVVTVDEDLCCIGSPNFNQRSMRQDDEVCLTVIDPGLTAILNSHYDEDLQLSERLSLEDLRRVSIARKAWRLALFPFRREL